MNKMYKVNCEIEGDMACFTDPASGGANVTYPVPTWSSVKGIFESVKYLKNAIVIPYMVQVCNSIKTTTIKTNYRGSLRKSNLIASNSNAQIIKTVLLDVCYKFYAYAIHDPECDRKPNNGGHAYQAMFNRNLGRNKFHQLPYLGNSEFLPVYVGKLRDETCVNKNINIKIPIMLVTPFDKMKNGKIKPLFKKDVEVKNGVLMFLEGDNYCENYDFLKQC